jgi:hypothetical protein
MNKIESLTTDLSFNKLRGYFDPGGNICLLSVAIWVQVGKKKGLGRD